LLEKLNSLNSKRSSLITKVSAVVIVVVVVVVLWTIAASKLKGKHTNTSPHYQIIHYFFVDLDSI